MLHQVQGTCKPIRGPEIAANTCVIEHSLPPLSQLLQAILDPILCNTRHYGRFFCGQRASGLPVQFDTLFRCEGSAFYGVSSLRLRPLFKFMSDMNSQVTSVPYAGS